MPDDAGDASVETEIGRTRSTEAIETGATLEECLAKRGFVENCWKHSISFNAYEVRNVPSWHWADRAGSTKALRLQRFGQNIANRRDHVSPMGHDALYQLCKANAIVHYTASYLIRALCVFALYCPVAEAGPLSRRQSVALSMCMTSQHYYIQSGRLYLGSLSGCS